LAERDPLVATLAEMARLLLTDFDIDDVVVRLCDAVTDLLPLDGAGVTQLDEDEMRVLRCTNASAERLERLQATSRHDGPCALVIEGGQPLQVDLRADADRWPDYADEARRNGICRVVVLPLQGRDRVWGVLDLYLTEDRALSEAEMETAQILADAATVYVLSAHDRRAADLAREALESQLLHDPLTGLPNRLLLADRLEHALSVNERPARSLAVLFVDLDGFKRVNDLHGHRAGDVALKVFADRLAAALRSSDTVARLGGDEFVVVCENLHDRPVADTKDVSAVGRRILDAIGLPVDVGEARVALRASIGAVWARVSGDRAEDVLHRADAVMYEAKRSGGDRVVISDRSGTTTVLGR
jgi:diguanylate cyclase (GGDEF)-like protein